MRAYRKKKYITLIDQVCGQLKTLGICDDSHKIDTLAESQNMVITIGNMVEDQDKCLMSMIEVLEEICELLYQISLDMKAKGIIDQVFDKLKQVKDRIEGLETEIEVLFLPYKASMWDTFDSIYKTACRDKQCIVRVVPLPYYSKDVTGKFNKMKYEGDQLPEEVDIIDYKKYYLDKQRPDVIFIHNPYDNHNNVTSLPQQYYSSELIKYTDHLVYIPYYVSLKDHIIEDHCKLPGVQNAWKVFVQSESIKERYKRYNPEEKIIAMGSPKFDMALLNTGRKTVCLEWRHKLEGKTVFLYNTHLYSLMNSSENILKNLRYVYMIFKNNDQIALIWRPHPLTIETLQSFMPDIIPEYLEIIHAFQDLPNVVYDDTGDLYDAVWAADAYMGDWTSSVILLFGSTGKPMYFMNQESEYQYHCLHGIRSICTEIWNDEIWMFSWEFNGLFRMNLETDEIKFETIIDKENSNDSALYSNMIIYNDKMFLIPLSASYLTVYDKTEVRYLKLEGKKLSELFDTLVDENKLWIFSKYFKTMYYCIDMKTEHIRTFNLDMMQYFDGYKALNNVAIFSGAIIVQNCVYRACCIGNYIFSINMDTGRLSYHELRCSNKGFKGLCYDGKYFWLLPKGNDNLVRWNRDNGDIQEFKGYPPELNTDVDELFCGIEYYHDCIWLIPQMANKIVKIKLNKDYKMECMDYMTGGFVKDYTEASAFRSYQIHGNILYLFPFQSNQIVTIDLTTYTISGMNTPLPNIYDKKEWIGNITHSNEGEDNVFSHIYKYTYCSLEDFISIICDHNDCWYEKRKDNILKETVNNDGTAGSKIWEYVKRGVTNYG